MQIDGLVPTFGRSAAARQGLRTTPFLLVAVLALGLGLPSTSRAGWSAERVGTGQPCDVAISKDDRVIASWVEVKYPRTVGRVAVRSAEGQWGRARTVFRYSARAKGTSINATCPKIAVDRSGAFDLLWSETTATYVRPGSVRTSRPRGLHVRCSQGAVCETPKQWSPVLDATASARSGHAVAVGVGAARLRAPGRAWSAPKQLLSRRAFGDSSQLKVAVGASGRAIVAGVERNSVKAAVGSTEDGWNAPQTVSPAAPCTPVQDSVAGDVSPVVVAASDAGHTAVAWTCGHTDRANNTVSYFVNVQIFGPNGKAAPTSVLERLDGPHNIAGAPEGSVIEHRLSPMGIVIDNTGVAEVSWLVREDTKGQGNDLGPITYRLRWAKAAANQVPAPAVSLVQETLASFSAPKPEVSVRFAAHERAMVKASDGRTHLVWPTFAGPDFGAPIGYIATLTLDPTGSPGALTAIDQATRRSNELLLAMPNAPPRLVSGERLVATLWGRRGTIFVGVETP